MVLKHRNAIVAVFALLEVAICILLFGGCGLLSFRDGPKSFNHRTHAEKRITCDACHYGYESGPVAAMPTFGVCFACHGPSRHREPYPYEAEMQTHGVEDLFLARKRFYDLKFSHAMHAQKNVRCEECHTELDADVGVSTSHGTDVETCQTCHRQQAVSSSCEVCHKAMRKDTRPPSHHDGAWMRTHGRSVAGGWELGHKQSCGLCHSQGYCDSCHQVEKPQDHSEFFRLRGHGFQVGIERERCTTCHQENFCVRCHQETAPRSHFMASWGGATSNHCLRCHEPIGDSRCSVCHKAAPSHLGATPIPGPPHPIARSDCYRCHLRPPHADNRMPCTVCHK